MHLYSARTALRYQFIIDSLDVWLPATNLGLVNFNDGILGIAGSVLPLKVARLLDIERIIHAQNCHVPHGHPQTLAIYRWEEIVSYFHCGEIILLFSCCTEHGLIHLFNCKWSVGSCPTRRYLLVHFASECILCERFPWPRGWCYRTRSKLVKETIKSSHTIGTCSLVLACISLYTPKQPILYALSHILQSLSNTFNFEKFTSITELLTFNEIVAFFQCMGLCGLKKGLLFAT